MPQKQLWAPWRMEYLTGAKGTHPEGCVFCALPKESDDRTNLIVHRGIHSFVILNRFPYNNGHLMVVPNKHTSDLTDLTGDVGLEVIALTQQSVNALKEKYRSEGFNIGMNLGVAGGAGIRDHLHMHVVPRWNGDTNFMPVLADTKSMPQHLLESFDTLSDYFRRR